MDVEVNSPDETEDEITSSHEFLPPLKRFKCEDIKSKEYFKEVKKIIFNNMDSCGSLSKLSVLNFHTKYRRNLTGTTIEQILCLMPRGELRENSVLNLMFRCSNKITRPCQKR